MTATVGPRSFEGPVNTIGVVLRRDPESNEILARLVAWCGRREIGLTVDVQDAAHVPGGLPRGDLGEAPLDLLVTLGGDGTLLRGARRLGGRDVPVLGVNLGRLGFLTSAPAEELETSLDAVVAGSAHLDRRFTLCATVERPDGLERGQRHFALNDVVVHKPGTSRVTPMDLTVGDGDLQDEIGSFAADGVILATPTGSTAYSLSAGGPIIVPDVACIVVTAICPHSLSVRPLVVPADERITVHPLDPHQSLAMTVDGQVAEELEPGDRVVVVRGDHEVSLVRFAHQTFFGTMRRKLNWAVRPPERS